MRRIQFSWLETETLQKLSSVKTLIKKIPHPIKKLNQLFSIECSKGKISWCTNYTTDLQSKAGHTLSKILEYVVHEYITTIQQTNIDKM